MMKDYRIVFTKVYSDSEYTNTCIMPATSAEAAEEKVKDLVLESNTKEIPQIIIKDVHEVSTT